MFESPTVSKGNLTIVDYDGIGPRTFKFHFNPTKLRDSHPATWNPVKIPGQALPTYQFGGGGERIISFTLRLDGDRGRVAAAGLLGIRPNLWSNPTHSSTSTAQPSSNYPSTNPVSLSIEDDLNFFRRFAYPGQSNKAPPRVLFSMGQAYRGLECILFTQSIEVDFWTPAMEPVRADVEVQLKQFARQPITRSQVVTY